MNVLQQMIIFTVTQSGEEEEELPEGEGNAAWR